MQLTCEQPDLLKGVQAVTRAISTRTTMPILSNILLESTKDGVKLAATDLELGIQTMVPARVKKGGAIPLPAGLLRGMVGQTAFAVSTDETRPFLTGVFFTTEERTVRLVATDGGRLALRTAAVEQQAKQKFAVIVPAKTMHELARALSGVSGDVTVALAGNHLVFSLPARRLGGESAWRGLRSKPRAKPSRWLLTRAI